VVEVSVADQRMLDRDLLRDRQGAADAPGINEDAVIDKERRWALTLSLAPESA
jgi:hypothetical protein